MAPAGARRATGRLVVQVDWCSQIRRQLSCGRNNKRALSRTVLFLSGNTTAVLPSRAQPHNPSTHTSAQITPPRTRCQCPSYQCRRVPLAPLCCCQRGPTPTPALGRSVAGPCFQRALPRLDQRQRQPSRAWHRLVMCPACHQSIRLKSTKKDVWGAAAKHNARIR